MAERAEQAAGKPHPLKQPLAWGVAAAVLAGCGGMLQAFEVTGVLAALVAAFSAAVIAVGLVVTHRHNARAGAEAEAQAARAAALAEAQAAHAAYAEIDYRLKRFGEFLDRWETTPKFYFAGVRGALDGEMGKHEFAQRPIDNVIAQLGKPGSSETSHADRLQEIVDALQQLNQDGDEHLPGDAGMDPRRAPVARGRELVREGRALIAGRTGKDVA